MATNIFCPVCEDNLCVDGALPIVLDHCEENNDELIDEIFFTSKGKGLPGLPSAAASWADRLSNSETNDYPIRSLKVVKGVKPLSTLNYKTNRAGNGARLSLSPRTNEFVIDDDHDAIYALMTALQCNGNVQYWYRSGKHIYGGQPGIDSVIKPTYGIVDDAEMAHRWSVQVSYTTKCEEPRHLAGI